MFSGQTIKIWGKSLDAGNAYDQDLRGPSAPLCLEFGSDIQLLLNEDYPGKQGTWNFQIQVNAFNSLYEPVSPQLDITRSGLVCPTASLLNKLVILIFV
jgi:hypothetical protein